MTLQAKKLVPDFVQRSTAPGTTERSAPPPSKPLVKSGLAVPIRSPLGPQAETVIEAPAGMWGY